MAIGGKNSDLRHGTQGSPTTLTDFTGKMRSAELDLGAEEVDGTVWGPGAYRQFEQSFKNATINAEYKYDATLFAQLGALFNSGQETDWRLSPDGVGSGLPFASGKAVMLGLAMPTNVGDLVVMRVRWRVTGAVTFSTHA